MTINNLILFIFMFNFSLVAREEIVKIGNNIISLTENSICSPNKWGNELNACKCCIVSYNLAPSLLRKKSKDIINSCTNRCSASSLQTITKKIGKDYTTNSEEFVTKLTDKTVIAKDLTTTDLKADLSEQNVMTLLNTATTKGFLNPELNCTKATKLGTSITTAFTSQLFSIDCSGNKMILKGLKEAAREIENLTNLKYKPANKTVYDLNIPGLIISKHALMAVYRIDNKRYYFSLLEAAKGKPLENFVSDAANNRVKREIVEKAYRRFGEVTADFHKTYQGKCADNILCDTIVHRDLHYRNVFFDPEENKIYFIDNESMASSVVDKKASPAIDLTRAYYLAAAPPLIVEKEFKFPKKMGDDVFAELTLKQFLKGYISRYSDADKDKIKEKLRDSMLKDAFSITASFSAGGIFHIYDPINLARVQKSYVKPIIDSL